MGCPTLSLPNGQHLMLPSHSLERVEERGVNFDRIKALAGSFMDKHKGDPLKRNQRYAIRSLHEELIFIVAVNHVSIDRLHTFALITVWDMKDGEFFHHKEDIVYDFSLTRKGPRFIKADETTIKRNHTSRR